MCDEQNCPDSCLRGGARVAVGASRESCQFHVENQPIKRDDELQSRKGI